MAKVETFRAVGEVVPVVAKFGVVGMEVLLGLLGDGEG